MRVEKKDAENILFSQFQVMANLTKIALLFVTYLLTAKFGLALGAVSGFATLVWPSTGIALAALLCFGFRLWPGIALGALVVNIWVGAPFPVACGMALGNTLEALIGAYLFQRVVGPCTALNRLRDVLALVILAAVLSTLVSATLGVTSLLAGGVIPREAYGATWRAWWIGDVLSDLVVAPLIMVWSRLPRFQMSLGNAIEGLTLGLLVLTLSLLIFGPWVDPEMRQYVFPYFIFPLLLWTTIRFGQHANVGFALAVSVIAIWGTIQGYGPFQVGELSSRLFSLQLFVASVSITGLFFGALGREKEEAIQLRNEFLSIASHELKTPLTSVKLQIHIAKREIKTGSLTSNPEKINTVLASAERQLDRLTHLIDDLLDISRIQAGHLEIEPEHLDLSSLVSEVLERFHSQIETSGCSLKTQIESSLMGSWDRYRMEQVVINLLSNALKYAPGKAVEVSLQRERSSVLLMFKDFGIGIATENQERIFEPFERAVIGQKISGLGLGLYITKQIIESHHGSIRVVSEIGKGSTFTIELPLEFKSNRLAS